MRLPPLELAAQIDVWEQQAGGPNYYIRVGGHRTLVTVPVKRDAVSPNAVALKWRI